MDNLIFHILRYPPEYMYAHDRIDFLHDRNINGYSISNVYYSGNLSRYDTLIKTVHKYNDSIKKYDIVKIYLKERINQHWNLFDSSRIKNELIDKKTKKQKKNNHVNYKDFEINLNVDTSLHINYELKKKETEINLNKEYDSINNILSLSYKDIYSTDTVRINYTYDYLKRRGRSVEFFQNNKYVRSLITLNDDNTILKEDFYMANYIGTNLSDFAKLLPYCTVVYQYYKDKFVKNITLTQKYVRINYLFEYYIKQ